ncbi:GNAT family N-acetyltransferase [Candidatus Bipolaricaulota bacterium]|nr:GNAT family N-acetyltransferase [Candidatus Bipolaricaulota bacterium]
MKIIQVAMDSPYINDVARLWRANKSTLGFFPEVALNDYAKHGGILAALDSEDTLAGYLLFYQTRGPGYGEVRVVHLCVDQQHRGRKIARQLIENLRKETRLCCGARARCRRDFPANSLWPKLGFYVARESTGRAGLPVTDWWLDYGNPDLLSQAYSSRLSSQIVVVIDACVFFALTSDDAVKNTESNALLAEWIPGHIEFCVTPELRNEIDRSTDSGDRTQAMQAMREFTELWKGIDHLERTCSALRSFFPADLTTSDESDLRELAYSVCGGASAFLTYDLRLLALDDQLYAQFGLLILRPAEFIVRLDEVIRENEYQPGRVLGSNLEGRRIRAKDTELLVTEFQQDRLGEKRGSLRERLSTLMSTPDSRTVTVTFDDSRPVLLMSERTTDPKCFEIEVLRVTNGSLETTLADFAVSHLLAGAIESDVETIRIVDPYLSSSITRALLDLGFLSDGNAWHRVVLRKIARHEELMKLLLARASGIQPLLDHFHRLSDVIRNAVKEKDIGVLCRVERAIWPAKIAGTVIPAFVVPIKPYWAAELFDHELAESRLISADPSLLLRSENVYYTGAPAAMLETPGRVLWYVSQDKHVQGSMAIRGASSLEEVVSLPPKDVYRRFRRLGIYTWKDVARISGNRPRLTALRFGRTEVLPNPIGWEQLQDTLRTIEGRVNQFQRPTRIQTATYDTLYAWSVDQESG